MGKDEEEKEQQRLAECQGESGGPGDGSGGERESWGAVTVLGGTRSGDGEEEC